MRQYILNVLSTLKDSLVAVLATLALFFGPLYELIFAAILFSLFDLLLAVAAAVRNKTFQETRLNDIFIKITIYTAFIASMHFLDTFFVSNIKAGFLDFILSLFFDDDFINRLLTVKFTAVAAVLIVAREMISINKHWKSYFGKELLDPVKPILNEILKRLKLKDNGSTKSTSNEVPPNKP